MEKRVIFVQFLIDITTIGFTKSSALTFFLYVVTLMAKKSLSGKRCVFLNP